MYNILCRRQNFMRCFSVRRSMLWNVMRIRKKGVEIFLQSKKKSYLCTLVGEKQAERINKTSFINQNDGGLPYRKAS